MERNFEREKREGLLQHKGEVRLGEGEGGVGKKEGGTKFSFHQFLK